jgi:hypothetical protein
MKIKINKPIFGHKVGQVIDINTNENSIPTAIYWRRRLQDAKIDNCIEIVEEKKETKETKFSKSEDKRKKVQKD